MSLLDSSSNKHEVIHSRVSPSTEAHGETLRPNVLCRSSDEVKALLMLKPPLLF